MEDVDVYGGPQLAHYMKLWTDVYALSGEIKGGKIPLNYKRFVVTSNFSIEQIYGPKSKMSDEEKEAAQITMEAIKARFKVLHIKDRADSTYWKEHCHELRPGTNKVIHTLPQAPIEKVKLKSIALIDRPHNVKAEIFDTKTK